MKDPPIHLKPAFLHEKVMTSWEKNLLPLVRKDGSVIRVPASQAWRPEVPTKNCRLVAQAYHPSVGEAEADLADLPADFPP